MSFFSTLKTALSLKEKLAVTGVLVLICALVGAGFAWERYQLKQALEKIGSLDQAVKERDKSIIDLNQTIETMNKADQHFHSQEVKNESEQAKYADRQMERKA
ncbi:ppfA, partial [Salmonella enterica subsp. enterica serovar Rissen]